MPKVIFLPKKYAIEYPTPMCVISITDNETVQFNTRHIAIGRVNFEDCSFIPVLDVYELLRLLNKFKGNDILVHCEHGLSRSAAVAEFLHQYMNYDIDFTIEGCYGSTLHMNRFLFATLVNLSGNRTNSLKSVIV